MTFTAGKQGFIHEAVPYSRRIRDDTINDNVINQTTNQLPPSIHFVKWPLVMVGCKILVYILFVIC